MKTYLLTNFIIYKMGVIHANLIEMSWSNNGGCPVWSFWEPQGQMLLCPDSLEESCWWKSQVQSLALLLNQENKVTLKV